MWVQAYEESTEEERKIIRRDLEGSSDKYARMICGWLEAIGWVSKRTKTVKETYGVKSYTCDISSAFEITALGELNYRRAIGKSKKARIPKVVYREMLASKPSNADYLRKRRSLILEYLKNHKLRSIDDIKSFLSTKKIDEETETIKDDMKGLVNIGMDIEYDGSCYKLKDNIEKLTPYSNDVVNEITDAVEIKERVRLKLQNVDHKYLTLIDYAFSGRDNDKNFEIYTIDLLVNELTFNGIHLGGTRKPDGIFYHNQNGVIIDNKAYSKGFTITRGMADEMTRYVQENNDRNPERNSNQWWLNFGENVNHFNFVFISSLFKGEIMHMLNNIKQGTGVDGSVLNVENLLYYADAIKGGEMKKAEFIDLFGSGQEIIYKPE